MQQLPLLLLQELRLKHRKTKTKSRILSHNQSLQIAYVHLRSTAYNLDGNICVRRPKPHQYWLPGTVVLTDKKNMHTKNKQIVTAATSPQEKENLELINAHEKLDKSGQRVGIILWHKIFLSFGNKSDNCSLKGHTRKALEKLHHVATLVSIVGARKNAHCTHEDRILSGAAWASCPSLGSERRFQEADQGPGSRAPHPGPCPCPSLSLAIKSLQPIAKISEKYLPVMNFF